MDHITPTTIVTMAGGKLFTIYKNKYFKSIMSRVGQWALPGMSITMIIMSSNNGHNIPSHHRNWFFWFFKMIETLPRVEEQLNPIPIWLLWFRVKTMPQIKGKRQAGINLIPKKYIKHSDHIQCLLSCPLSSH